MMCVVKYGVNRVRQRVGCMHLAHTGGSTAKGIYSNRDR